MKKTIVVVGYSGLYRNTDGSFTLGPVHSTEDCVIASISPDDDRVFCGAQPIQFIPEDLAFRSSGRELHKMPAEFADIEASRERAKTYTGFGALVRGALEDINSA